VSHNVIDGDRWIAERLALLSDLLDGGISDEERTLVEAEIKALSKERGIICGGHRVPRPLRRWRGR
jgi:hypothetical protein